MAAANTSFSVLVASRTAEGTVAHTTAEVICTERLAPSNRASSDTPTTVTSAASRETAASKRSVPASRWSWASVYSSSGAYSTWGR